MTEQQQTGDQYEGNALAQTVARYARTFSATRRHIINPDDQDVTLCGGRVSLHELYVSDGGTARMAAPWMVYTQIPCQRCERSAAKRGILPDTRERDIDKAHDAALAERPASAGHVPGEHVPAEHVPGEMLAGGALELAHELLDAADRDEQPAAAPTLNDFELDECDGADRPADDQEPTLLGLIMQYRDARVADADALLERIRAALDAVPLGEVSPVTLEPIPATCASRIPGRTDDQCTHDALLVIAARGPVATESLPAGLVGRLVGAGLAEGADLTGAHLALTDAGQRAAGAERARMAVAVG